MTQVGAHPPSPQPPSPPSSVPPSPPAPLELLVEELPLDDDRPPLPLELLAEELLLDDDAPPLPLELLEELALVEDAWLDEAAPLELEVAGEVLPHAANAAGATITSKGAKRPRRAFADFMRSMRPRLCGPVNDSSRIDTAVEPALTAEDEVAKRSPSRMRPSASTCGS